MPQVPFISPNKEALAAGSTGVWNKTTAVAAKIIEGITTDDIDVDNPNFKETISGISSIWARALIFKYAFQSLSKQGVRTDHGMMKLLKAMLDDWKGFVCFMAIESVNKGDSPLRVKKIYMKQSELAPGLGANQYEFKKTLGDMLFEDKKYWRDSKEADGSNPHIQVILYEIEKDNQIVLGACSPHTIFFTPANIGYTRATFGEKLNFFNDGAQRWDNPISNANYNSRTSDVSRKLTLLDLQNIYDYVDNMLTFVGNYINAVGLVNVNYLQTILAQFKAEILAKVRAEFSTANIVGQRRLINTPPIFSFPFDFLLYTKSTLIWNKDITSFRKQTVVGGTLAEGEKEISPAALLSPCDTIVEIHADFVDMNKSYLLKCNRQIDANGTERMVIPKYYVIPLSQLGIRLFNDVKEGELNTDQNSALGRLLGENELIIGKNHTLKAVRMNEDNDLMVTLSIEYLVDGNTTSIYEHPKKYRVRTDAKINNEKAVLTWPNFVSPQWNKYFLFSEFPQNENNSSIKIKPLTCDLALYNIETVSREENHERIEEINHAFDKIIYAHTSGALRPYEVYQSETPFRGVEVVYGIHEKSVSGYIIRKEMGLQDNRLNREALDNVTLAVDFGSNNTSIAIKSSQGNISRITLSNRRCFILGKENNDNTRIAYTNELMFFQNDPAKGQLKSMFMLHDEFHTDATKRKGQATGGHLVNEKNIPITGREDDSTYLMQGNKKLKFNLKWLSEDRQNDYLLGFLNTLLLNIEAELFHGAKRYAAIKIAYPDAMGAGGDRIFGNWRGILPSSLINELGGDTESKAVAYFALNTNAGIGGNLSVPSNTIAMGFDLGGSTTDLFFIKNDGKNNNYQGLPNSNGVLIKQNSLMIAANSLAQLMRTSAKTQKDIADYLKEKPLFGNNTMTIDSNNVVFVFNAILDKLYEEPGGLNHLYNYFVTKNQQIFAVASYTTGFLLFYAGMMAKAQGQDLQNPSFKIGIYGKGGNIYNWLTVKNVSTANNYYRKCFSLGYQAESENFVNLELLLPNDANATNKMEVVFGLLHDKPVDIEYPPARNPLLEKENKATIVGEEGYTFHRNGESLELDSCSDITVDYFKSIGSLNAPKELKQFNLFIKHYLEFCRDFYSDHQLRALEDKKMRIPEMISNYITSHPEYRRKSTSDSNFDFKTSFLALEAMCFFENGIMQVIE